MNLKCSDKGEYCLISDSHGYVFCGFLDGKFLDKKNILFSKEEVEQYTRLLTARRIWANCKKIDIKRLRKSELIGSVMSTSIKKIDINGPIKVFQVSNDLKEFLLERSPGLIK